MEKQAYVTKKEVHELTRMNEHFARNVQDFFIKKFKFKKVDKTSLERAFNDRLLELRIYGLSNGIYMSLTFFGKYHEEENISSIRDVEQFYRLVKTFIKNETKGDNDYV